MSTENVKATSNEEVRVNKILQKLLPRKSGGDYRKSFKIFEKYAKEHKIDYNNNGVGSFFCKIM